MWFFYSSEGIIADTSLFDPKGNLVRAFEEHYLTEAGVDLDKTQLTIGQPLRVDGDQESSLDNAAANALLTREYRAPFVAPKVSEV
jgi:hypothetical protein